MSPTPSTARGLRIAFGVALLVGGLLHGSGFPAVVPLVANIGNDAKVIFPALWVSYAWHYVALGLIVLLAGRSRRLLALAALVAVVDGLVQVKYFGYSPSELVLFTIAAFGVAAAWAAHDEPTAGRG